MWVDQKRYSISPLVVFCYQLRCNPRER